MGIIYYNWNPPGKTVALVFWKSMLCYLCIPGVRTNQHLPDARMPNSPYSIATTQRSMASTRKVFFGAKSRKMFFGRKTHKRFSNVIWNMQDEDMLTKEKYTYKYINTYIYIYRYIYLFVYLLTMPFGTPLEKRLL